MRISYWSSDVCSSDLVAPLVLDPLILAAVERILGPGCDRIQLNLAQAIEIHPGEVRQFPHRDHDMWRGADGRQEYLINILRPLTSFTARSDEHTSELQSLMRNSYAVVCLTKKKNKDDTTKLQ